MIRSLANHRRVLATGAALVVAILGTTLVAPQSMAQRGTPGPQPGSPDSGDSLFPHQGNGGYNVGHYGIRLRWFAPNRIVGTTFVKARATQNLSSFNLDLHGFGKKISASVNGVAANSVSHTGDELTITPAAPIINGRAFVARIDYAGIPQVYLDPDGSADGWIKTPDGATSLGEPVGSMTWFPNNNTPRDKATYDIVVTAPKKRTAVSNGRLVGTSIHGATKTWHWRETDRMATYLASVSIGYYDQLRSTTASGIPIRSFIDPKIGGVKVAQRVGPVLRYWESKFGPYPFRSVGVMFDNVPVGYALEVQTRPVFPYVPDMSTLVHELAHQWFGDSVTPIDWSDIWLNEGFATYAEWMWAAKNGNPQTPSINFHDLYDSNPEGSSFWSIPVAQPGDGLHLFGNAVYDRGAMAVQAIRMKIGSHDFLTLLKRWTAKYSEGNATTDKLQALAETISGKDLDALFETWLYTGEKPPGY